MQPITRENVLPKRRADILENETGRETILYSDTDEALHVLNATAKLVWSLCDGEHSLEDAERQLREQFSVPEGQDVALDIRQILAVFAQKGLLLDSPSAAASNL